VLDLHVKCFEKSVWHLWPSCMIDDNHRDLEEGCWLMDLVPVRMAFALLMELLSQNMLN